MKIAFTSCMSAQLFPGQPVWDEIAAANPDVLVLLGDSVYLDVGGPYDMSSIKALTELEFATHMHKRFFGQVAHTRFKALVQKPQLATYAIWDDHDFLWNNACGADVMANPALKPLIYPSRAIFNAWRAALAQKLAAGSFPAVLPPWTPATPEPGYSAVALPQNVLLHLTDGRTWREGRGKKAMLGMAQLDAMEAAMHAAPSGTVHLVASGSVFDKHDGENWLNCKPEYDRMQQLAVKYNILMLSGDIHDNNLASYVVQGGRKLFEATASGAAVRTAVVAGALQRNYGMLTVDSDQVGIEIFKVGNSQYRGSINRATWA